MSRKVAKVLYSRGLRKNDTVQNIMPNNTDFYWSVLGSWLCQATVTTSDPSLKPEVLAMQMEDIHPKFIFCCKSSRASVEKAVQLAKFNPTLVIMDEASEEGSVENFEDFIAGADALPEVPRQPCDHEGVPIIFWSSGTTGRPKGIQYTMHMMLCQLLKPNDAWKMSSFLISTCFFHTGGFTMPLISGLVRETPVVFVPPADVDEDINVIFPVVDKLNPPVMMLGSHHCVSLAKAHKPDPELNLTSIFSVIPMGANVYPEICQDLKKNFPNIQYVMNFYGQTEIPVMITMSLAQDYLGGIQGEVEAAKIIDPESGEALGPNEVGELVVKPQFTMKGYLNRPEENATFFGEDGWIHTGDLMHYNEEGVLFYDARLKNLIKYKNCHLYPIEIEDIIQKHPDVIEVGVFGLPEPTVQELVTALVVKKENGSVTEEELIELVNSKVDDFKKLRGGVKFVEKLPRNPQGKLLRRQFIETYNNSA